MNDGLARILVVDDEPAIQTLLNYPLRREGYSVVSACDGQEALRHFAQHSFNLVVLDLMLPGMSGLEICRRIRENSQVPIIMLTAKDDEGDKVAGLETGADDYITKPFSMREFRSRVKAALRRAGMTGPRLDEPPIRSQDLEIDLARRKVKIKGSEIGLTFVEFEILTSLASSPGRVISREALLEQIWGGSGHRDPRTIDVHIRHLREKIEDDSKDPEYLFTVRGAGYHFREDEVV